MTKSFNKTQIGLAVACALALGILSGAARAQSVSPETAKDRELVQDTRATVVKSGFGLCWHSGFGPPPAAGPECDPSYVAYVAPPVVKSVPVPPPAMIQVQAPAVVAAPAPPPQIYVPPERPARKDRN
jgi:OmpA-OmpF porin, OOP family